MGITPAIEMGTEAVTNGVVPQIVVASRQSIAPRPLASQEQREHLASFGISEFGLLTTDVAKSLIIQLRKGLDKELALAVIENHNGNQPIVNHEEGSVSRIYKYPHEYNWLVIVDEAHKSSLQRTQTAHWFSWFGKNPHSRRKGLTATPKRSDKVSIGTLFHGVTIDYPLYSMTGRCAVKDGYAVPYVQKYIEVEGVDFKQLKKVKGDYDEAELERVLAEEHALASYCGPTLDLVGDRRTLVFSPTVAMAQAVTGFINARTECKCHACNAVGWYPRPLIGDGATCRRCNAMLHPSDINEAKSGPQAACIYGEVPKNARKEIYRQHQDGTFQFLSVCGLCREGYNDPDISCVAVFRPVSKDASSLAEQMKGRASRPLRGLIEGMESAEQRLEAIRTSRKPDALIIDLVGITGLADCATTVQIYAEGLPDHVIARAEEIALTGGVPDIQEAIAKAQREDEEEKERRKQEREERRRREQEEAERRSKAQAEARYTEHERGNGTYGSGIKGMASEKQLKYIHFLGMDFAGWEPTISQAGRIITQLKEGMQPSEVAYKNGIAKECWSASGPSVKQMRALARMGINAQGMTPGQVQEAFSSRQDPRKAATVVASTDFCGQIQAATGHAELSEIGQKIMAAKKAGTISDADFQRAVELGREQRSKVF
jgi:superfamily II DNA or RNA helicase